MQFGESQGQEGGQDKAATGYTNVYHDFYCFNLMEEFTLDGWRIFKIEF